MSKQKRGTRESTIEAYFVEQVEKHGGMALKLVDTGRRGFPDRTVVWDNGKMDFVELKRPLGGKVAPWQSRYHNDLRDCGVLVWVLDSKERIDTYIGMHE